MKNVFLLLLIFVLGVWLYAQTAEGPKPKVLVFTHVTVIDATGAPPKRDMTVVVTDNRITAIGKSERIQVPKDAHVVGASDKFLIPGLWDMHVHVLFEGIPELVFPLIIGNGITGIRDMSSNLELTKQLREQIENGSLIGPRIVAASPIVDGPNPFWPGSIAVTNETEAREAALSLKKAGADFVKVYSGLSRESYFAIADEAKEQGLPFAGHVPTSISAAEASDAGQSAIEHLDGVFRASSSKEAELMQVEMELLQAVMKQDARISVAERRRALQKLGWESYSEEKATALIQRFANNGTWQVPTLIVSQLYTLLENPDFLDDPRLKYMPPFLKEMWNLKNDPRTRDRTAPEDIALARKAFQKALELVGAMHRAGVGVMAGTDALSPYCFPGFSLHDELVLLVKAGLTPMEALQTATRNPAKYLGKLDSLGTIEEGKIGDMVLLAADPLEDISNTRKISAVVFGGKLIPKSSLQEMLSQVEAAVKEM